MRSTYYGHELSIDASCLRSNGRNRLKSLSAADNEYSLPVVRLFDSILTDAVKREASDIHFEPRPIFLSIVIASRHAAPVRALPNPTGRP
jgi:general secretion pathway protein E/type IV pilus assembly protein PilB